MGAVRGRGYPHPKVKNPAVNPVWLWRAPHRAALGQWKKCRTPVK